MSAYARRANRLSRHHIAAERQRERIERRAAMAWRIYERHRERRVASATKLLERRTQRRERLRRTLILGSTLAWAVAWTGAYSASQYAAGTLRLMRRLARAWEPAFAPRLATV